MKLIKSIIIFLLFLEVYFWIGSFLTQSTQSLSNAFLANRKGSYRIMCVGESLTLVGGKNSYPSQLEDILNRTAANGRHYQVLNQGRPGATSKIIAEHLPYWLDEYKPDMVIAMIGILDESKEQEENKKQYEPSFVEQIKLVQLYHLMCQRMKSGLQAFWDRQVKKPVAKEKPISGELEQFKMEMDHQSEDIKKIYLYILLAEANNRYDMARQLYQKFFENTANNSLLQHWMYQKYGNLLNDMGSYEEFVNIMDRIGYGSWKLDWVKGYCHTQENMDKVANKIEYMVAQQADPLVYGYVASCYEQGGRADLAAKYLEKMKSSSSMYNFSRTRRNYMSVKKALLDRGIIPIFVQYPVRDIAPLKAIFADDPDREKIIFVDNGPSFQEAVRQKSYEYYFIDRMSGDVGHATREGNHLLASNVAKAVLSYLGYEYF